jgi:hypothetical protein
MFQVQILDLGSVEYEGKNKDKVQRYPRARHKDSGGVTSALDGGK